jgi:DNA-binding response OmpR family regulator
MAAGRAHMVRALQLAAVRAFLKGFDLQRIMATTHAALRRRGFSLGDSHLGTCSISKNIVFQQTYAQMATLASKLASTVQTPKAADEGRLLAIFPCFARLEMADSDAENQREDISCLHYP